MRLDRYLSTRFIMAGLAATAVLVAVAEVFDLVDNAGDILAQGEGLPGLGRYVLLRLPTLASHALPLGVLSGALISLALLARNSEIVAMRAAGRSSLNLFVMLLPGAFLFAVAHCALLDLVVPRSETRLATWLAESLDRQADAARPREAKPTWLRVGDAVVSFDGMSDRGRRLSGLRIFERSPDKVATARIIAAEARYEKRRWTLTGAVRTSWRREDFNAQTPADGEWATTLRPADVLAALTPGGTVSAAAAQAVLSGERVANAPRSFYETLLQRIYAAPVGAVVMLLLAMPAAFVNGRDARSSRKAFGGLIAGLAFLLADGLLTTLGQSGVVPPVLGAWTAVVAFGAIGFLILARLETGSILPTRRRSGQTLAPEPRP